MSLNHDWSMSGMGHLYTLATDPGGHQLFVQTYYQRMGTQSRFSWSREIMAATMRRGTRPDSGGVLRPGAGQSPSGLLRTMRRQYAFRS